MRIVFMGTPEFAAVPMEKLVSAGYEVALAVTKPDRPKDRGKKMQSCAVKLKALELGIPVSSPEKIKGNAEFFEELKAAAPDIIIVAAYGKILPKEILELPPLGCINIHGSLLPKYRGAAPIQRAVLDCEEETGVTLMHMAEGMDTGDMIAKASTPVLEKTSAELFEELSVLGSDLLLEYLPKIADGSAPREAQNEADASYAPMVFKEDQFFDYSKSPESNAAIVRALGGITKYNGENLKVFGAHAEDTSCEKPFGFVVSADKTGIRVSCGGKLLVLTNIQLPGKKAMDVSAFLLGNKIEIGTILG